MTVKFFTGGSEANEAAIKLARQFWLQAGHPRKYKVISRYRATYHGGTGQAMAASAQTAWKWKFEPFAPGFVHVTPRLGQVAPPAAALTPARWPASI